jgi:hypothetical protein
MDLASDLYRFEFFPSFVQGAISFQWLLKGPAPSSVKNLKGSPKSVRAISVRFSRLRKLSIAVRKESVLLISSVPFSRPVCRDITEQ